MDERDAVPDLRSRALKAARDMPAGALKALSAEEAGRLLHELQVHQIELEMQNEELRRAQVDLEAARARYFDLYNLAPVAYFTVSEAGVIVEANLTAANLLRTTRQELAETPLPRLIERSDQDAYHLARRNLLAGGIPQTCEVRLQPKGGGTFWAHMEMAAARHPEAGAREIRIVASDVTERRKAEESRRAGELARKLVVVQEEERRRLAQALHDQTSPNLAALMLSIEVIAATLSDTEQAGLATRLEDTRALLQDTMAKIKDLCFGLRPAALDYFGLTAALEELVRQFQLRTGIAVGLRATEFEPRLPPEVESALFHIAQEALTNCARHSRANTAVVTLEPGRPNARLTIEDPGVGFAKDELSSPGLGLITMRERAEFAGGRFEIDSQPGAGTRIVVDV